MRKGLGRAQYVFQAANEKKRVDFPFDILEAPCAAKESSPPSPELSDLLPGYDLDS